MKNRTFAKLISLMLALLMVMAVFAACDKGEGEDPAQSGAATSAPAQNGDNANADAYTEATEGAVDLSAYTIIFPEDTESDTTKATATFENYLKEYCGIQISKKKDSTVANKSGKEILIGLTDRQESKDAYANLKTKDWSVSVKGDKIVIAAGSETSIVNATNWIVENALQKNNKFAKIGSGFDYKYEYLASDVKVGDKAYANVTVTYLSSDNAGFVDAGLLLADNLKLTAGLNTSVANNATTVENGLKILVCGGYVAQAMHILPAGLTVGAGKYAIQQVGDDIMIVSDDGIGAEAAAQKIIKAIVGANKGAVDLKTLCTTGAVAYDYKTDALDVTYGAEYRIMSYNIERAELGGTTRYQTMVNAVTFYNPDVVGFQEYCVDYDTNATPLLTAAGYSLVEPVPEKYSENDNACSTKYNIEHNYTPIAYKTAKFDLVASGAKRIVPCRPHETTGEGESLTVVYENTIQPSYGWPGYTLTWAVLKDKTTGDTFAVTSLHNLTGQTEASITAKKANVKDIILPLIEKIATDNNCPVFMTGDYNSKMSNDDLKDLTNSTTGIKETADVAVRGASKGSSSGEKGTLTFNAGGEAIDHIFMKGEATVVRHRYCLSQVTSDAADHRPVVIDVAI